MSTSSYTVKVSFDNPSNVINRNSMNLKEYEMIPESKLYVHFTILSRQRTPFMVLVSAYNDELFSPSNHYKLTR